MPLRQPANTIYGPVIEGRKADGSPVSGVLLIHGSVVTFQSFAETPPTKTLDLSEIELNHLNDCFGPNGFQPDPGECVWCEAIRDKLRRLATQEGEE